MGYPLNSQSTSSFYQAVIAGDIICTLSLFLILQSLHYCIWGHDQQLFEYKKNEEPDAVVEPLPKSEWKWDQKSFNMYFAIIFGNHVCAVILPLAYYPSIFSSVVAYAHLACFLGMLINTICVNEKENGKGGRTIANRIIWIIMCLMNLILIAAGLTGVPTVIV